MSLFWLKIEQIRLHIAKIEIILLFTVNMVLKTTLFEVESCISGQNRKKAFINSLQRLKLLIFGDYGKTKVRIISHLKCRIYCSLFSKITVELSVVGTATGWNQCR